MSARAEAARGYRMRPAPRSRRRGRGASRINWDKVGRVALVIVLVAILLSYIGPTTNVIDAWRDSKAERANLVELKQENRQLNRRMSVVAEPEAAERAARKTGMVAANESAYVIRGLNR